MWRLLSVLAVGLLALCALPLTAGRSLAGPALAGGTGSRLAPGPGEWWLSAWQVPRKVWPLSQGAGVTVAEVDSGVQASLPDLRGVVLPGINLTSADLTGTARHGTSPNNASRMRVKTLQRRAPPPARIAVRARTICGASTGSPAAFSAK